jgi:GxxExxY protein
MLVHRELGPGLDEVFYHDLLSRRLQDAAIAHESRSRGQLVHRGLVADIFEADLLFPSRLVAELKCPRGGFAPEYYVQLICYLKFWRVSVGMLFDFAKDSLLYRRVNYSEAPPPTLTADDLLQSAPDFGSERPLSEVLCQSVMRISREHGLGYRDTTYRGLLAADLTAEGLCCAAAPVAEVGCDGGVLGETRCDCLAVENVFGVLVLALRTSVTAADRATLQTYLRLLHLPFGLILNFRKNTIEGYWVSGTFGFVGKAANTL